MHWLFFGGLTAILLFLAWIAPKVGAQWLCAIERKAASVSRRKTSVLLALGVATALARLALLAVVPVPVPAIHDEFSYLLAADTFAHGRLTNPPHPMWIFFDTFHVLQQPTYASKYPPAQGAAMALGQLLGHPWIGVLLSLSVMVMAMTWMLQGWFPPPWALLGGVLVALRLALLNPWVDSYFNGAVATIGAALVLGAYPRIFRSQGMIASAWMGIGALILANSRPFEGLVFCIPVGTALVAALLRRNFEPHARNLRVRTFVPAFVVVALGGVFVAFYNWRVTQDPLQFPYLLYHREYFHYPMFAWQQAPPPLHYSNAQFEAFFNGWHRNAYRLTIGAWRLRAKNTFLYCWRILPGFLLAPAFVLVPRILRDRRMRLPLLQVALCLAGLMSVVWFQPHYVAPLAATFFVLLVQAMRHLRHSQLSGRPIGLFFTRLIMLLAVVAVGLQAKVGLPRPAWARERAEILRKLEAAPGKHLILVHYSADHNPHQEWVYNGADIDGSKVVWARQIPGRDLAPLLDYFRDRQVWWLEPDHDQPQLRSWARGSLPGPETKAPASQNGHPSDNQDPPTSTQ